MKLETRQPPPLLPGSRSDLAVWKRKVFPSLQRAKRDTLVQSQGNWHTTREQPRGTCTEMEGEGHTGRVRVTRRGLISEVKHFEQQRESPGWKISEPEERDGEGANEGKE